MCHDFSFHGHVGEAGAVQVLVPAHLNGGLLFPAASPPPECPMHRAAPGPVHQDRAYDFVECPMKAAESTKSDIDPANMVTAPPEGQRRRERGAVDHACACVCADASSQPGASSGPALRPPPGQRGVHNSSPRHGEELGLPVRADVLERHAAERVGPRHAAL